MHQTCSMSVTNAYTGLRHQTHRIFNTEALFFTNQGFKIGTINVFDHDENLGLIQTEVMNGHDIRM